MYSRSVLWGHSYLWFTFLHNIVIHPEEHNFVLEVGMLEQRQTRIQELMSILLTLGYRVPHFPQPWWVWHVWHHVDQPPLPSCSNDTQKTLLSLRSRILLPPRAPQTVQCTKKAIKSKSKNQTKHKKQNSWAALLLPLWIPLLNARLEWIPSLLQKPFRSPKSKSGPE